jgi:hypothetical protein
MSSNGFYELPELHSIQVRKGRDWLELVNVIRKVLSKFPEYVKEDLLKFPIHVSLENTPKAPLKPIGVLVPALGYCRFNDKKGRFEIAISRMFFGHECYVEEDLKERVVAEELLHVHVAIDSGFFDPIGIDEDMVRDLLLECGFKIPDEEIIREYLEERTVIDEKDLLDYVEFAGVYDRERVKRLIKEELNRVKGEKNSY